LLALGTRVSTEHRAFFIWRYFGRILSLRFFFSCRHVPGKCGLVNSSFLMPFGFSRTRAFSLDYFFLSFSPFVVFLEIFYAPLHSLSTMGVLESSHRRTLRAFLPRLSGSVRLYLFFFSHSSPLRHRDVFLYYSPQHSPGDSLFWVSWATISSRAFLTAFLPLCSSVPRTGPTFSCL